MGVFCAILQANRRFINAQSVAIGELFVPRTMTNYTANEHSLLNDRWRGTIGRDGVRLHSIVGTHTINTAFIVGIHSIRRRSYVRVRPVVGWWYLRYINSLMIFNVFGTQYTEAYIY